MTLEELVSCLKNKVTIICGSLGAVANGLVAVSQSIAIPAWFTLACRAIGIAAPVIAILYAVVKHIQNRKSYRNPVNAMEAFVYGRTEDYDDEIVRDAIDEVADEFRYSGRNLHGSSQPRNCRNVEKRNEHNAHSAETAKPAKNPVSPDYDGETNKSVLNGSNCWYGKFNPDIEKLRIQCLKEIEDRKRKLNVLNDYSQLPTDGPFYPCLVG